MTAVLQAGWFLTLADRYFGCATEPKVAFLP